MNFLRSFLASLLAIVVGFLVAIPLMFIVIGGIIASAGKQEAVVVSPGTVLEIKLNKPIVENAEDSPFDFDFDELGAFGSSSSNMGLWQIVQNIDKAKNDPNINGIYLNLQGSVPTGWANMTTIREALIDFKTSGKFIYSYGEVYGEGAYYLASVADSVFMAPEGIFEFNGLASNPVFLTGMFEKLDIEPRIFRVGTFKSAVEPYFRKDMSEPSRLQTEKYLGVMWESFIEGVSVSRKISKEQLNQTAETFMFGRGQDALNAGLIDGTTFDSEMLNKIKAAAGKDKSEKVKFIGLGKYMKTAASKSRVSKNKIAVVFAEGTINSGKSSDGTVGSESIVKALRKARLDDNVKGIVLRVNSPGGSALASDMIAEEIRLCSEAKPIVASMGNVAASGGYYISAPCDKIFAQENTITGSIGIFGILWEAEKALEKNIGLTFDEVETHSHANIGNPTFPIDNVESAFIQANVEHGYGRFIQVVKDGRNFADSLAVDKIAQGRVWAGKDAKDINLIDEFGDLSDAIAYVSEQVGISDDHRVIRLPKVKNPFEKLIEDMTQSYQNKVIEDHPMGKELKKIEEMKRMIPESGLHMLMPYYDQIQ
ncbi:MAG: signal peptide peptidase SppA [Bacteroidia bacterium]|nr:signal peptide peptidase SppA [Bacteroidia bacterium]